jgi:hypothetical protein
MGLLANHKVRFVRPAGTADVYDLNVPEYHNFVAEGVVVHNSHQRSAAEFFAVWHNRVEVLVSDPKGYKPIIHKRKSLPKKKAA